MLKIGKGLKKKKKSKKHKKDEELFTQEELEQYKREHQQRCTTIGGVEHIEGTVGGCVEYNDSGVDHQAINNSETTSTSTTKPQDLDEWKKFNELTTGIDSILNKTKDDLDRIKQTSFFKRTPPPKPAPPPPSASSASTNKTSVVDHHTSTQQQQNWIDFKQQQQRERENEITRAANVIALDESASEYETDEDDDNIFDTSYVDVVASGEIKLAYIPDDDDDNDANATNDVDPFDTSVVDKIIRGPEVSKKGKKLVSIGSAVEVLTGRVDPSCILTTKSPSIRRKHQIDDLLIVDEQQQQQQQQTDSNGNNVTTITSLLDDDVIIDDQPITLTTTTTTNNQQEIKQEKQEKQEERQQQQTKSILDLNEFDILTTTTTSDDLDDEFTNLAAESLKTTVPIVLDAKQIHIDAANVEEEWNAFENVNEITTTTTTTNQLNVVVLEKDLLGGSTTDLSSQLHETITPITTQINDNDNDAIIDPFDTSSIDKINIPGKIELKFIEAELLGGGDNNKQTNTNTNTSDNTIVNCYDNTDDVDDFNPRKEEQQLTRNIDIFDKTDDNDLSVVLQSIETLQTPALKPIPALSANDEQFDDHLLEDPFDTSFIATVVPGKAELKLIENELATIEIDKNNITTTTTTTTKLNELLIQQQQQQQITEEVEEKEVITDLLYAVDNDNDCIINTKVLTPVNTLLNDNDDNQLTYVDPFDTTNNTFNILPGKAELKLLENELLTIQETITSSTTTTSTSTSSTSTSTRKQDKLNDLLTSLDDNDDKHFIHNLQPLTPATTTNSGQQQQQQQEQNEDFDPFDTTLITTNLVPGVVELKLIESELIQ